MKEIERMIEDEVIPLVMDLVQEYGKFESIPGNVFTKAVAKDIEQYVIKAIPKKKEISKFEMKMLSVPLCKCCELPHGNLHDRLVYNECIAELKKGLKK